VSIAIGLLLIMVAALFQVAVVPSFSIFGAHPNLLLVLLVAWFAVRGQREAFVLVPLAGLALGLLDSYPLGLTLLALAPLILLSDVHELRLIDSDFLPAVAVTAVATAAYEGVLLATLAATGDSIGWLASARDVIAPAIIANILLLPLLYLLLRAGSFDLRRRRVY
jgi:rod shape-determining protein MreD